MKKYFSYSLLFIIIFGSCQSSKYIKNKNSNYSTEAEQTMSLFRKTSPFLLDNYRLPLLTQFEVYSDKLDNTIFKEYLISDEKASSIMEDSIPILYSYKESFDKVLRELKTTKVKKGTAAIWMLYNMGFIVKTPSGCFGIDIDHKYSIELEPYLDFICITHNHGDHYNTALIDAMNAKGKPILSNFYAKDINHMSKTPTNYEIGNFKIKTDISDHLRDSKLADFVTVFRIECGDDAGNFSLLHCGDSGFNPVHFTNVEGKLDLAILRWGAARENDILGNGSGQVQTKYAILSHLIELRHKPYPKGQASITQTLKHLPEVKCDNTIIPFWGEKMTWEKGVMY